MLFTEIDNLIALATLIGGACSGFFGTVTTCFTAWLTYQMWKVKVGQEEAAVKLDGVMFQVHVIEKATNSMKDALVLATEKEALARGTAAGIASERDKGGNPVAAPVDVVHVSDEAAKSIKDAAAKK